MADFLNILEMWSAKKVGILFYIDTYYTRKITTLNKENILPTRLLTNMEIISKAYLFRQAIRQLHREEEELLKELNLARSTQNQLKVRYQQMFC